MTTYTTDRANSGEIQRIPGETRRNIGETTVHVTMPDAPGEPTQRIDPRLIQSASFDAIPRRTIDIDDTVTFHSPMNVATGVDQAAAQPVAPPERVVHPRGLAGPQKPPPPLPKPPARDPSETGVNIFGGLGADLPQPDPEPEPDEDGDDVVFRRGCGGGRHQPQPGSRLACRAAQRTAVRTAVFWTALVTVAACAGLVLASFAVGAVVFG